MINYKYEVGPKGLEYMLGLKQRFNDMSMTRKLMLMSIGGIVMPLLIGFSAFTFNLYGLIEERQQIARESAERRIERNVYEFFDDVNDSSTAFSADTELYRVINREGDISEYQAYLDFQTVTSRIKIIPWNIPEVTEVTLYHKREDFPEDELLAYISEDVMKEQWYKDYLNESNLFRFDLEERNGVVWLMSSSHFTNYSRAIDTILRQGIQSDIIAKQLMDDYIAGHTVVFLLDDQNRVVARSDRQENLTKLEVFMPESLKDPDRILYKPFKFKGLTPGWQIAYYYDQSEIRTFVNERLRTFFTIMIGVLVLSFTIILLASKTISHRLIGISDIMKNYDGGLLIKSDLDYSEDEIGTVVRSYNGMVDQLDALLKEKATAYEELESFNEELTVTNEKLATVNQELTASFEEIRIQDVRIK